MKNVILLMAVIVFTVFTTSAQVSSLDQSDAQKNEMDQKRKQEQERLQKENANKQVSFRLERSGMEKS